MKIFECVLTCSPAACTRVARLRFLQHVGLLVIDCLHATRPGVTGEPVCGVAKGVFCCLQTKSLPLAYCFLVSYAAPLVTLLQCSCITGHACHLQAVKRLLQNCQSQDVTLNVVPGGYHELFMGPEKEQVTSALRDWILSKHPKK